MKKQILNELNRVREIMGLEILLEQKLDNKKTGEDQAIDTRISYEDEKEKEKAQTVKDKFYFFTNDNKKFRSLLINWKDELWGYFKKYAFPFPNTHTITQNLIATIQTSPFKEVFRNAQNNYKYLSAVIGGEYLLVNDESEVKLRLMKTENGRVRVRYQNSLGDDINGISAQELCRQLNQSNSQTLGKTQITGLNYPTGGGNLNKVIREGLKTSLYLFSSTKTKSTYSDEEVITQVGVDGVPATVSAQGDPIKGGDAFEVYEVAPDSGVVADIVTQIKQGAGEGMDVVNVAINGVASELRVKDTMIPTWKENVGAPYNTWNDEKILNFKKGDTKKTKIIKDGAFTEPVTGNQVLAYLRAQNLGKALEKAGGIKVTNYNYSVGGADMKVDVIISQEKPGEAAKDAIPQITDASGNVEKVEKVFDGTIYSLEINFPANWKTAWKEAKREDGVVQAAKEMLDSDDVVNPPWAS